MEQLVGWLFLYKSITQTSVTSLWDSRIIPIFNSLSYADFSDYLARSPDAQAYIQDMSLATLQGYITCNLQLFNDKVGKWKGKGNKPYVCVCLTDNCCESDEACPSFSPQKRLAHGLRLNRREDGISLRHDQPASLKKRVDSYGWSASRNGQSYSGSYSAIAVCWPIPHPSIPH